MSRIGKKPVVIPAGVEVKINGADVKVKGPKGELAVLLTGTIKAHVEGSHVVIERGNDIPTEKAKHGLYRSLINNMVTGVTKGFEKSLEVMSSAGSAYRVQLKGKTLELELGFAEPVKLDIPAELQVEIQGNNQIVIRGADKQKVGQFAAYIRSLRKPDVYRDRGIKYRGEWVRRIKIAKFGLQA